MYYELRTYTLDPLKMADWLALYQSHALEVQSEHLGNLVGFFTSEFGDVNQVVHIWAYESLDERIERRAALYRDAQWLERFIPVAFPMLVRMESKLLMPAAFSPIQ